VIDVIDNQGAPSNDLNVNLVIGGGGNQPPTITGQTHLVTSTGEQLSSSQLGIAGNDPDGPIDHYTFYDSTPGDGHLTLDGSPISGAELTVTAGDLGRVGYQAGLTDGGTNAIAVQAFDSNQTPSNVLQIDIDVANSSNTSPTHTFIPVDTSEMTPEQQQQLAELDSLNEDLTSLTLDALANVQEDWSGVAAYAQLNPTNFKEIVSHAETDVLTPPGNTTDILENIGSSIDALTSVENDLKILRKAIVSHMRLRFPLPIF
jgi:hypothetical protein